MSITILWILVALLLFVGLLGTVVPGLPGIAFVFAGILIYAVVGDFAAVSIPFVVIAAIVSLLAVAADYAGSALGARAGGGKWKAMAGGILGVIVGGVVLGPLGIFLGALLGAFLGALVEGLEHKKAARVAAYTVVGVVGSAVVQFILALSLIIAFFIAVFV